MAQLSDKFLSWLYSSLLEYRDVRRTYSDMVKVLATYQNTIKARTATYEYENGTSALLFNLYGMIPVTFRGTTYLFPISAWIPRDYPHEPPIIYVNPGKDMIVRPGQHVSVDGRVYHPYLRDWSRMWEHAGTLEFIGILQHVFSKEPPVMNKAQQQQYQRPIGQTPQGAPLTGPPPPQLPPKQRPGTEPVEMPSVNTPPPRPPKPGEQAADSSRHLTRAGPPLPPLPHEFTQTQRFSSPSLLRGPSSHVQTQVYQSPPPGYQNGRPPGPPVMSPSSQQHLLQPQQPSAHQDRSPVSPLSPVNGYSELPENRYSQAPPLPSQQLQRPVGHASSLQPSPQPYQYHQPVSHPQPPQPYATSNPPPHPVASQPTPQARKIPPVDLLSDPFDVALPSLTATGPPAPAPPIPPNPEKEHLLQAISDTLVQQARQTVTQNLSAITPLFAQQTALKAAHERLEAEIRQLEQLDQALSSNEAILRRSIQDCDRTIETAKSKKQPAIDDVLLAPTMVANQLWTLCAEEAACREAMYVLQKALDRGRVSGNDFARQMRGLGRECFLKMALARKCARGMGLEVTR